MTSHKVQYCRIVAGEIGPHQRIIAGAVDTVSQHAEEQAYKLVSMTGATTLFAAVEGGDRDRVADLLESGSDPNLRNDRSVPVIIAAATSGQAAIVELLLSRGAAIGLATDDDDIALMYAATLGQAEIVKILLAHGVDPNHRNRWGRSVLDWAENPTNSTEIVAVLQAARARMG